MMRLTYVALVAVLVGTSTAQFDDKPLNRPPASKIGEDCRVPRIDFVVCGSDGFEYVNEMELLCARRVDEGLSVANEGRCSEAASESKFKPNPVFNRFNRFMDKNDEPMGDRQ